MNQSAPWCVVSEAAGTHNVFLHVFLVQRLDAVLEQLGFLDVADAVVQVRFEPEDKKNSKVYRAGLKTAICEFLEVRVQSSVIRGRGIQFQFLIVRAYLSSFLLQFEQNRSRVLPCNMSSHLQKSFLRCSIDSFRLGFTSRN